jgi:tetratricopeptide (TPR) repeat protein
MHLLGHPEDSLQILEEGERLSKGISDERNLLIFQSKLGTYYALHGEPSLAIQYTEDAFRKTEKLRDIELIAPIACELCNSYLFAGEFSKMSDVASKVLFLLENAQRERDFFGMRYNVYSGLCSFCVLGYAMQGNFEEAEISFNKGFRFASEVCSLYGLALLQIQRGWSFAVSGDGRNTIDHILKAIDYLEEAQAAFALGFTLGLLGYGYYLLGELQTAQKHIEKSIDMQKEEKTAFGKSLGYLYLSIVHFDLGDFEKAQKYIEEGLKLSHKYNEKHWQGWSTILLGRVLAESESRKFEKSEEYILEGIKLLDELQIKPFSAQGSLFLGELHIQSGDKDRALEALKTAEQSFQEMGMDYWLGKTREMLERI